MLLTVDNLGEWGIFRDGLPHELPDNAWSAGQNVRFREAYAEKVFGHSAAFGASDIVPYHVAALPVGSARWWVEAGLASIYSVDDAGAHVDITNVAPTGTADDRWTSTVFGGILVLNNGVDRPFAWAGSGTADALADWPSTLRAKSVRAYRNYLVAVNVSKDSGANWYPHMVKWSHAADPGTVPSSYDETDPTVDAGEFDLADTPSHLVDSLVLGDGLMLYKEGAYYRLDWVGGGFIFQSRLLSSESGMLARNCAAAYPGGHCVLGQGDVFVHGGGDPQTILTARARRWLFANLDATYYARSFVTASPLTNEIWICFPSIGASACDRALIWNWRHNTFGVRDLPDIWHASHGVVGVNLTDSWDADLEPWNTDIDLWNQINVTKSASRLVLASNEQSLYLADDTTSANGTAMPAYLERTGISLGEPNRYKLLKGLRPIFEGQDGNEVSIRLGASDEPNTPPTWSDPIPFVIGRDYQADGFASGRYLAVRIESNALVNWRIKRLQLEVEMQGNY